MSDDKTFTQDEVNTLLANEKRKHRDEFDAFKATVADYDDLKTQVGTLTAERDTWTAEKANLETRTGAAEQIAMRYDVAAESDLPLALASRLTGSTKEELVADAAKLKSLIPSQAAPKPPTPTAPPAPKPGGSKGRAAEALRQMRKDA